jgi:hypothetical protein
VVKAEVSWTYYFEIAAETKLNCKHKLSLLEVVLVHTMVWNSGKCCCVKSEFSDDAITDEQSENNEGISSDLQN